MALVDANYRIIYIDIGCNGRVSDGGVFDNCSLSKLLSDTTNPLHIPPHKYLPGRNTRKIPHFIVADEAFPLKDHIMKPYPQRNLNIKKRIYNYRLSRARRIVENAFGILSARYRLLRRSMNFHPNKVELFVYTICLLHNKLTIPNERNNNIEYNVNSEMNELSSFSCNASTGNAREIRDEVSEFCSDEDAVDWQLEKL